MNGTSAATWKTATAHGRFVISYVSLLPVQYFKVLYSCDRFYCETYPMVLGAQYDMLLTGPYTEETVIEFLYKYTAHNNRGDQIWESRVSRWYCFLPPLWCLLTLMVFTYLFRCLTLFCEISDNVNVNLNESWCWKNYYCYKWQPSATG